MYLSTVKYNTTLFQLLNHLACHPRSPISFQPPRPPHVDYPDRDTITTVGVQLLIMPTVTDLHGLPASMPELANLSNLPQPFPANYSLYYTASISEGNISALVAALNTPVDASLQDAAATSDDGACGTAHDSNNKAPDSPAQLAPSADFTGKSLRDVVVHHVEAVLGRGDTEDELSGYHPTSVIDVTDTDWRTRGVLLISLDTYIGPGVHAYVLAFPHPAAEAASVLDNIEVANTSWKEAADAVGVVIPERETSDTAMAPSALDQWDVDTMGYIAVYTLYGNTVPLSTLWEAVNGSPSCWDRRGVINRCPCCPCEWQYRFAEEIDTAVGTDAKIAAVVAGHLEQTRKSSIKCHERLILISDEMDLETEGVLIMEFDDNGGDAHLERVAVADLVDVLLLKVTSGEEV